MHIIFYKIFNNDNYKNINKKNIIILIDKNKINTIIITLIRKIKEFLKNKYKFNSKIKK